MADVTFRMNSGMHIEAKTDRVCLTETETFFDDQFFESLDMAVNALDNVAAGRYMDSHCMSALRPFLESGTLGTKGTRSGDRLVPDRELRLPAGPTGEKTHHFCTIHSFPTSIDHCMQWARDTPF